MIKGNPIAQCYLRKRDKNNYLYLSDAEFVVVINGLQHSYDLTELHQLQWKNKNLLLHIIAGGIIISLSIFAYMNHILHPWLFMPVLLGSILMMYHGFLGAPALVLILENRQEHYLLRELNSYLTGYTDFVNSYLLQQEIPSYYLQLEEKQWKTASENGFIEVDQPLELYTSNVGTSGVLLELNIQEYPGTVIYLHSANNKELKPHVTQNIPLSVISRVG